MGQRRSGAVLAHSRHTTRWEHGLKVFLYNSVSDISIRYLKMTSAGLSSQLNVHIVIPPASNSDAVNVELGKHDLKCYCTEKQRNTVFIPDTTSGEIRKQFADWGDCTQRVDRHPKCPNSSISKDSASESDKSMWSLVQNLAMLQSCPDNY